MKKLFHYAKITNDKDIINLEQFIKIKDIILLMLKNLFYFTHFKNFKKININLDGLYFEEELNDLYKGSYINRSKLEIYSKAIPRF